MISLRSTLFAVQLALALATSHALLAADTVRVATYNLENYLLEASGTRVVKSPAARAKIRQSIIALKPDVIALEEVGGEPALLELRSSLKADGYDFPHWTIAKGFDTNIFVCVLSKLPFTSVTLHSNLTYLLTGRRLTVSRGFADVEIKVNDRYAFTLLAAHLKSRRTVGVGDEADMRLEEAKILRGIVDAKLAANPNLNLIVCGDFNDVYDNPGPREVVGRNSHKLVDSRPYERNGDNLPPDNPRYNPRNITWTHYYGKEDTYSRIDYLLLSPGMAKELVREETYVLSLPNWGAASDHRPIVATFTAEDK